MIFKLCNCNILTILYFLNGNYTGRRSNDKTPLPIIVKLYYQVKFVTEKKKKKTVHYDSINVSAKLMYSII